MRGTEVRHEMYSAVAEQVRRHRLRQALSQERLGMLAGLSTGMISHVETGRAVPSPTTLRKIALALGVSPMELMDKPEKENEMLGAVA